MASKNSELNIPKHVAIIMDGNRRWAAQRGLGPVDGHRFAAEKAIKPIVEHGIKRGIKYLTFWAFSSENKKRDSFELKGLFQVFRDALKTNLRELEAMGVKIQIIGEIEWFPIDIAILAKDIAKRTSKNKSITVSFALNYGGREEILRAVNKILRIRVKGEGSRVKEKELKPVTEEEFAKNLDTAGMPDPDLVIRTGGNMRLSGYFPWQTVYSELYFTPTLWPDFSPSELDKILEDFSLRARRFGGGSFKDYLIQTATKLVTRN